MNYYDWNKLIGPFGGRCDFCGEQPCSEREQCDRCSEPIECSDSGLCPDCEEDEADQ